MRWVSSVKQYLYVMFTMVKIKAIPGKQRLGRKEGKGNSERRRSESEVSPGDGGKTQHA